MEIISIILNALTLILIFVILVFIIKSKKTKGIKESDLKQIRETVNESINALSISISNLIAEKNSKIMDDISNSNAEMNKRVESFSLNQDKIIKELDESMSELIKNFNEFKERFIKDSNIVNSAIKQEISDFKIEFINKYSLQKEEIMTKLSEEIKEFNNELKKSLDTLDKSTKEKLIDFKESTKEAITELNNNVSKNLKEIREDNNSKLEQINVSVNEKLQNTLEQKLKDSFKSVVDGIGFVNQAVGEIKGLANDVGSLKSVLTNVKQKGIMGEVILGNIIRDFLTPSQYAENVATKRGSSERVEFAIILPGTQNDHIYLPVDSKFPYQTYSIIHESQDIDEINEAKKKLRSNLLKYAKDVSEKYIDVPNTTDFAVIFLPLEGLYLEALNMGLFEEIQRQYKVNLTGPTTFTAFINSLNMGFKSLMIQKKSADVFKLLGAVKTEFGKFADALEKTQKKVDDASKELENLVGQRTKALNRKLNSVDALDEATTKQILENNDN